MKFLEALSIVMRDGSEIYVDKINDKVMIKNYELINKDNYLLMSTHKKEIISFIRKMYNKDYEDRMIWRFYKIKNGWSMDKSVFIFLNKPEVVELWDKWINALHNNGMFDNYDDYTLFETEDSDLIKKDLITLLNIHDSKMLLGSMKDSNKEWK